MPCGSDGVCEQASISFRQLPWRALSLPGCSWMRRSNGPDGPEEAKLQVPCYPPQLCIGKNQCAEAHHGILCPSAANALNTMNALNLNRP